MTDDRNRGELAYETYCANLPLVEGMASWGVLNGAVQRTWDEVADAVRAPLLARIDDLEAEIQGYRGLCADIESTMVEPDKWDGDEAESAILGRYVKWLAGQVAVAPATGTVSVTMTRDDAQELQLILTGDRYHMDRGDGEVPQPRWGANVRVSEAVDRALGLLPQESWPMTHHTDIVRRNRERWFREVPGAREAYLADRAVHVTIDSVDAALSAADREMEAEGIAADVREHVLTVAVSELYDYNADAAGASVTVYGIRTYRPRPEDDGLRKLAAEIPPPPALCHVQTPHPAHHWADRGLRMSACPGRGLTDEPD